MTWIVPLFSRKQVDRAGSTLLRSDSTYEEDLEAALIVSNWRSSHTFPLYVFKARLRRLALDISDEAIVSGRIKRFPSILSKLVRHDWLKLSRIQDIAGCRAILPKIEHVDMLTAFYETHLTKHELLRKDDYIAIPKPDGYRSVHLVYRYYSDKKPTYNGLIIEIQIRSQLQHEWATMVETVDVFTQQFLKFGMGQPKWERLFQLLSAVISAMELRPSQLWKETKPDEILNEIRELLDELSVENRLNAYRHAIKTLANVSAKDSHYLLVLDKVGQALTLIGFKSSELPSAVQQYKDLEEKHKRDASFNIVLASAGNVKELKLAYPNYFVDTEMFLILLKAIKEFDRRS